MLETDYLVIGAGALSISFIDELIHKSQDIRVVVVEKRAKPGGHWNDAYPFVRLHQPAAWYGVNSTSLGKGGADLVSKSQILAYYEAVTEKLVLTNRVTFHWQCEYMEDGNIVSLLEAGLKTKVNTNKFIFLQFIAYSSFILFPFDNIQSNILIWSFQVSVLRKVVDGTRMTANVPSMRPPSYKVGEGVNVIPLNGLADLKFPYKKYVVVGAGKTGLDALLYLLERNVSPERISWIVPNDCWYLNRDVFKMDDLWSEMEKQYTAVIQAKNIDDLYLKYEELGIMMRIDKNHWPSRMRGATISCKELEKLQAVKNIFRHGRIKEISSHSILFENGTSISTDNESLYVDCSASGCGLGAHTPAVDIFNGKLINLQMFLLPQPCTCSAIIAALELRYVI